MAGAGFINQTNYHDELTTLGTLYGRQHATEVLALRMFELTSNGLWLIPFWEFYGFLWPKKNPKSLDDLYEDLRRELTYSEFSDRAGAEYAENPGPLPALVARVKATNHVVFRDGTEQVDIPTNNEKGLVAYGLPYNGDKLTHGQEFGLVTANLSGRHQTNTVHLDLAQLGVSTEEDPGKGLFHGI